jgi:RNA-binding protein YhbY
VTPAVVAGVMDALVKRGFVRLKVGAGGSERKALAAQLARLLDAEVVHQVGGGPRP